MGDDLVLAIDQGTSSTKALVINDGGEVIARGQHPVTASYPRPGWVEQSAAEIWASTQTAVAQCLDGDTNLARIAAVGLSTQREALVLWDRRSGEPVGPLISWQDRRTAGRCAELAAEGHGEFVRRRSGLPLDPMFSATKATWLLDAADPDRTRARRGDLCLGTVDSWLLHCLGREHLTEVGNATRTQLLDIHHRAWDPELLDLFNVPAEVLPTVVPSTGPFPTAERLPTLSGAVPITGVLGDSHAALYAHGGWRPGAVKATYGTGSSVMGLCPSDAAPDNGVCLTIAWQDQNQASYALEGNIRSSGATLVWLADLVGKSPATLAELAAHSGSDGVVIVPAFNGLGAPWWDDNARATLSGMTLGTGLAQIARAVLESIALQVEDVVAAVEETAGAIKVLLADGGASANPVLMQIQADLSGRVVNQSHAADLSALGAAHLAAHSAGIWNHSRLENLNRPATPFTPTTTPEQRAANRDAWHQAIGQSRSQTQSLTPALLA